MSSDFVTRVHHTLDGAEIAYRLRPGRDPWVLLHGLGCDASMWDAVVARLPEDVGLLIPDLRGHGDSTLGWRSPGVDLWADDVLRIVRREEIKGAAVAGLSMGGYTAMAVAAAAGEPARAWAFLSTSGEPDDPEARLRRAMGLATIRREGWQAYASSVVPALLVPDRAGFAANRDHLMTMFARAGDSGLTATLFALANRPPRRAVLASLKAPAVAIVGDHDTITPAARAEEIAATVPGARLLVLPGVAHMSAMEAPEEAASAIASL
jgi:pimeloyl-ACP methyl ester carboxylesterase